jgi:hypothetical protein
MATGACDRCGCYLRVEPEIAGRARGWADGARPGASAACPAAPSRRRRAEPDGSEASRNWGPRSSEAGEQEGPLPRTRGWGTRGRPWAWSCPGQAGPGSPGEGEQSDPIGTQSPFRFQLPSEPRVSEPQCRPQPLWLSLNLGLWVLFLSPRGVPKPPFLDSIVSLSHWFPFSASVEAFRDL